MKKYKRILIAGFILLCAFLLTLVTAVLIFRFIKHSRLYQAGQMATPTKDTKYTDLMDRLESDTSRSPAKSPSLNTGGTELHKEEPTETAVPARFQREALELAVAEVLEPNGSPWIVYAESLTSKDIAIYGKDATATDQMIAASMIKIFIMAAAYDQVEQGSIPESDLSEDIFSMITVSDNNAANRVTKRLGNGDASLGRQTVTDFARSIGCPGVEHNRLMLEDNGTQNYVSAADCARLLRMIYEGDCISSERSAQMLEVLLAQRDHDYIPAGVPDEVAVAHKGGDLMNCQGDVGIVFSESGPYIVCIISNSVFSEANTKAIGQVSALIFHAMNEEYGEASVKPKD